MRKIKMITEFSYLVAVKREGCWLETQDNDISHIFIDHVRRW